MSDKQENENAEVYQTESRTDPVAPTKKKGWFVRHLKRFWWVYLIIFLCGVVLVTCLV
jgi:hypothetical protein